MCVGTNENGGPLEGADVFRSTEICVSAVIDIGCDSSLSDRNK